MSVLVKSVFLLGITGGNGDLSRKRERLHTLSLLDDLLPVAVVKSLARIRNFYVAGKHSLRGQDADSSAKAVSYPLQTGQHFV